jgi:hypothetical protein
MIKIITGGTEEFNALVYGHKHPQTQMYLEQQAQQANAYLTTYSATLNDAGRAFFTQAQEMYDRFNGAEAQRVVQAALAKAGGVLQPETIRDLWQISDVQNAPLVMQRFIMANPVVRDLYHQQRIDGYSDTYLDMEPNSKGLDHYDYRRVVTGMVMDDEEHGWKVVTCFDELKEGDRELQIEEKAAILSVWDLVEARIKDGRDDPTSKSGGSL